MATASDSAADIKASGRGWSVGLTIPGALLIAAVTALSSGAATRCSAPESPGDAQRAQLLAELADIKATQIQILEKISQVEQDSKNRDVVQDAAIATIRNR